MGRFLRLRAQTLRTDLPIRLGALLFVCLLATAALGQSTPTSAPAGGWRCGYGTQDMACPGNDAARVGALTTQQMELQFGQAFMQGAINGFVGAFRQGLANAAAARQQQQAFQAEMARRQQEAEEQRRIAEQQRIAAMFARLDSELKLSDLPFQVPMKYVDVPGPENMQMKGMDTPSSGEVKMKFGDDSTTSTGYGLKGLPGIYTGGPAGGATPNSSGTAPNGGVASDAPASDPNSTPGEGTTGSGIPGLPGLYLDGAQPNQAPQLAQAAQNLPAGPERDITEDTALQAALHNPALTAPTQDPQVANFQKDDLNYQQSLQTATTASQQYTAAQSQVVADQSAIATAKAQLAGLQPTVEEQAALSRMLDAAKTNEAASEDARRIFEDANAHLSIARTQATQALASLPRDPSAAPIHLGRKIISPLLRPAVPMGSYASAPGHPLPTPPDGPALSPSPAASTTQSTLAPATPRQLCAQLASAQIALRRLAATQQEHSAELVDWGSRVEDASDDAWQRGLDMAREFIGKGVNAHIEKKINGTDQEIQELYLRVSNEKNPSNMVETQKEWEALEQHKLDLQDALERAKKDQKQLDILAQERDFFKWNNENKGDLNGNLEGVRQIVDNLIGDEDIQKKLGISEASDAIKYGESIVDSSYDILSEVLAAQRIRQLEQNTERFLQEQQALQQRIQSTIARLNVARQTAPAGEASCSASMAKR